jgi:hypothetical protein
VQQQQQQQRGETRKPHALEGTEMVPVPKFEWMHVWGEGKKRRSGSCSRGAGEGIQRTF